MQIRAIARHLGISKNTVKRALADGRPPQCQRPAKGSAVDAVEVQIRELLRETPTMPATAPSTPKPGMRCGRKYAADPDTASPSPPPPSGSTSSPPPTRP